MATDLTKMVEEWWKAKWGQQPPANFLPTHRLFLAMAEKIEDLESRIDDLGGQEKVSQKLTDQQKSIYLEQHPEQCPFCRSEDIGTLETFEESDGLTRSRACNDCKRRWIDHYTLTGVENEIIR